MRSLKVLAAVVAALAVSVGTLYADFTPISAPDAAYLASTTKIAIPGPYGYTPIAGVSDGTESVTFSGACAAIMIRGGDWATWSDPPFAEAPAGSAFPGVYSGGATLVTLTLGVPTQTFGVEMEPNPFAIHGMTADFYNGATLVGSVSIPVDGQAGARLFAGGTTTDQFTSVVLSSDVDFAFSQIRYGGAGQIPEPSVLVLLGLGVVALGRRLRKRVA